MSPKQATVLGAQEEGNPTQEVWISRRYAEHMIAITRAGVENENKVVNDLVKFKDYRYVCDLGTPLGRSRSEAIHKCGREGIDIYTLKPARELTVEEKAEQLRVLRDMTVGQLRAMLELDEYIKAGVNSNTVDKEVLITLIMQLKSLQ